MVIVCLHDGLFLFRPRFLGNPLHSQGRVVCGDRGEVIILIFYFIRFDFLFGYGMIAEINTS